MQSAYFFFNIAVLMKFNEQESDEDLEHSLITCRRKYCVVSAYDDMNFSGYREELHL